MESSTNLKCRKRFIIKHQIAYSNCSVKYLFGLHLSLHNFILELYSIVINSESYAIIL